MIVNMGYRGKVGAAANFTYTGNYNVRKDGVVELLTSGTIVFLKPSIIDVFMVGGGSGGTSTPAGTQTAGFGGGAGGYTRTIKRVIAEPREYQVIIGLGGQAGTPLGSPFGSEGGSSGFGGLVVSGGTITRGNSSQTYSGKNGGSGGGGGVASNSGTGDGGSDGADGQVGYSSTLGGKGQGFTTREFGEPTGKLYAGGGGGGRYMISQTPIVSAGGAGGGGTGAWYGASPSLYQAAAAGVANTGGGGGGGAAYNASAGYHTVGASGGSGIVCFRDAAALPELVGTWKFNSRIYPPETAFDITSNYTITSSQPSGSAAYTRIYVSNNKLMGRSASGAILEFYDFSTNTQGANFGYFRTDSRQSFTDEFTAWLASNASKQ